MLEGKTSLHQIKSSGALLLDLPALLRLCSSTVIATANGLLSPSGV